jgi:hypothetical protein
MMLSVVCSEVSAPLLARFRDAVLAAMRAHSAHASVQMRGCKVVIEGLASNFGVDDVHRIIVAVLAALHGHAARAGVQERGYDALPRLMVGRLDERLKARLAAMLDGAAAALRTHVGNAGVQRYACAAVNSMLCGASSGDIDSSRLQDAANAVLAAMQAHPAHADVQQNGCDALRSIFSLDAVARLGATSVGAADVLLAAMRGHPTAVALQSSACCALELVVCSRAELLDGGEVLHDPFAAAAIEPAVAALRLRGSHARGAFARCARSAVAREINMRAAACWLLSKIAEQSTAMATCAGSSGAVEAVVAALSGSCDDLHAAGAALRALDALTCGHAQNSGAARRAGAAQKVAEAVRKHSRLQQRGAGVIAALQQPVAQAAAAAAAELLAEEEAAERCCRPQQSKRSSRHKKRGGDGSAPHAAGAAAAAAAAPEEVPRKQLAALVMEEDGGGR